MLETRPRPPNLVAALAPVFFSAALLLPGTFDPLAPLESAPAPVWFLLLAMAAALAAAAVLARRDPVPRLAAVTAFGLGVSLFASLSLAEPLLVFGGRRFGFALFAAALAPLAAAWAIATLRRAPLLFLVAVAVLEGFSGMALTRGRLRPPELLRQAMYVAPGWGQTSLAGLERRDLLRPWSVESYPRELRRLEGMIEYADQHDAFDVPDDAWEDDSHLVRGWLLLKLAAAPGLSASDVVDLLKRAGRERLRFAADPLASPEPFTAGGILHRDALRLTEDLNANDALRLRIATAWSAVELFSSRANDAALEREAIGVLRSLYDDNHLDRLDPFYLETFSLEGRLHLQERDAAGYLALFDRLAADTSWPEGLRKKFAARSAFLRAHPENGYEPAILHLLAEDAANREEDPAPFLDELKKRFPDDPLAKEPAAPLSPAP